MMEEHVNSSAPAAAAIDDSSRGKEKKRGAAQNGRGLRADWARLTGHTVEVWLLGQHVITGVVDQAAEDDSVLWIAGAGISTRRLFDKSTGYQMWV
jgi:hypothetical protein